MKTIPLSSENYNNLCDKYSKSNKALINNPRYWIDGEGDDDFGLVYEKFTKNNHIL